MKLLFKISLILIIGMGTTFSIVGILNFYYTRALWESLINDQQVELGTKVMNDVDSFLYERYLDIGAIGDDYLFEQLLVSGGLASATVEDHIHKLSDFSGPWQVLSVVNLQGIIVASTIEEEIGKKIEEKPNNSNAFRNLSIEGNQIYFSDFVHSDNTGKPVMIFAGPVKNQDKPGHPMVGVVIGELSWLAVQAIIQNTETNTELNLYAKDGKLLATNQESPENLFIVEEEVLPLIQGALKEGRPVINLGADEEKLRAVVPSFGYLGYKGNGHFLLAEALTESIFASAREQSIRTASFLFLGFLVALVGVLWFLSWNVIFNIALLSKFAKNISEGDLSKKIHIKSHDEIGQLAAIFNDMVLKLNELYSNLDRKVLERTKELDIANDKLKERWHVLERLNKMMVNRELKMIELKKEIKELKEKLG